MAMADPISSRARSITPTILITPSPIAAAFTRLYGNGTRRLGAIDFFTTTPSLEVRSYINQLHIGSSLAAADLNGDGTRDLIIGGSGAPAPFNVKGSVYVFQGGAGLSGARTLAPTNQATWQFRSGEITVTFASPEFTGGWKTQQ